MEIVIKDSIAHSLHLRSGYRGKKIKVAYSE